MERNNEIAGDPGLIVNQRMFKFRKDIDAVADQWKERIQSVKTLAEATSASKLMSDAVMRKHQEVIDELKRDLEATPRI